MSNWENVAANIEIKEDYELSVYDSDGNRMEARSDNDSLLLQEGDKVLFKVVKGKVNIVVLNGEYIEANEEDEKEAEDS